MAKLLKKHVILDVDTGIDDAVAIAMATYSNKLNNSFRSYQSFHSAYQTYNEDGR